MRGVFNCKSKRFLGSVALIVALLVTLSPATIALAQPPLQGAQPVFAASSFASADGSSSIQMQETTLNSDFLAANGNLDGVVIADGLTLAEGQPNGIYVSGTINSPLPSTTDIAPTWAADVPAGAALKIETRVNVNGNWSGWVENPAVYFPVRDNQFGGALIWIGGGQTALEFRITFQRSQTGAAPVLRSITLAFSNSSQGPTASAIAAQVPMAAAANVCPAPKPTIVSRTTWGCPDGQNSPRWAPSYAPVTHVIVHHTATPNDPQDWAAMVRSLWNVHANLWWWGDIGYNYLIDPNGVIYEGRAGGDDVVGRHDTFNAGSMAIGFIGCYGNCAYLGLYDAEPSQAMLDAGVALAAWKLGEKGIDPTSTSQYNVAGIVPVIAGGRDVVATFSPGDYLYAKLPWMRDAAAQRVRCQACSISDIIFDKTQYNIGETIYVTARVVDQAGSPISGARVTASVTPPVGGAATSTFDLADLTGYYQGSFSATSVPGSYRFDISASDPSGRFTPCSSSASVNVGGVPTPTGVTVKVEPERLTASWCAHQPTMAVSLKGASQVRSVALEVQFNPQIVQVVDADPNQRGVQVRLDGGLLSRPTQVLRNEVDTGAGRIFFEATMLGSETINGDAGLIIIDWRPQSPGTTNVALVRADLTNASGQAVPTIRQDGVVEITADCVSGTVVLQGRSDFSGVSVTSSTGAHAFTDAQGRFGVSGGEPIQVSYPGYLSATAEPGTMARVAAAGGEPYSVGSITLLAGDLNQDNSIDIFDVAMVASRMDTADPTADLNADGVVNILDLSLVAGNYGQRGPQTDWR